MELQSESFLQGGKYKIERILGQGGFGITYLGLQTGLNRKVAIKEFFIKEYCDRAEDTSQVTVNSQGSRDIVDRFRKKFIKEAQTIAQMDNSYVVRIHDIFEENATAYFVMEYIPGGSLDDLIKKVGILNEVESLNYIRQVAEALEYIHNENILHLDIKPSNILLRTNNQIVLIDFGISKRYDETGGQTSTTPVGVSKGYAPIEQYKQGGVGSFLPCTDVYSLGATFYKLLTGKTPPEASDIFDEGLPALPDSISSFTSQAIQKAMQPGKKQRPQSIQEFLALLKREVNVQKGEETKILLEPIQASTREEETKFYKKEIPGNERITVNGVSFDMVYVEGGEFEMGRNSVCWNATCVHPVILSGFHIGKTEVTQALWMAVMGNNPSHFKGDDLPVEKVSWNDCQDFIKKLNNLSEKSFRLPTEAEWEYAARGGNKKESFKYSGSNDLEQIAWYEKNSKNTTHPIGRLSPNGLGLYDMSGNVWEWCGDWYDDYTSLKQTNPWGPTFGSYRVVRGGCWNYSGGCCAVSYRDGNSPDVMGSGVGFRLALAYSTK